MDGPEDRDFRPVDERFQSLYGKPPAWIASAPGRLEVLGNHTDYNQGLTLSCAVGQRCVAVLSPSSTGQTRVASTAYDAPPRLIDLAGTQTTPGDWSNYVRGLLVALQRQGIHLPAFELLVDSRVPTSAGMSSSSALGVSVLLGVLGLTGVELPPLEVARLAQEAESVTVGARTGLLDPMSSLMGKRDQLLLIDFRSNTVEHIPLPDGFSLVAIDSGVKHDLTGQYNDRRKACEQAASEMRAESLRGVALEDLEAASDHLPQATVACARHVIEEITRVQQAKQALAAGDLHAFGQLMFASHASSRDLFKNSCQALDRLVGFAEKDPRCLGARLSGGGFGGITIHLLPSEAASAYRASVTAAIKNQTGAEPWSAICVIGDGARLEKKE